MIAKVLVLLFGLFLVGGGYILYFKNTGDSHIQKSKLKLTITYPVDSRTVSHKETIKGIITGSNGKSPKLMLEYKSDKAAEWTSVPYSEIRIEQNHWNTDSDVDLWMCFIARNQVSLRVRNEAGNETSDTVNVTVSKPDN